MRVHRLKAISAEFSPLMKRYSELNISLVAGGMAYYVMLALAPTAIAVGALVGLFVDPGTITQAWAELSPRGSSSFAVLDPVAQGLTDLATKSSASAVTITTISSAILAIYVSQKVVYGVHNVEDQIFHRSSTTQGLIARGWSALIAFIVIIVTVALLLGLTILPRFLVDIGVDGVVAEFTNSWIFRIIQWLTPFVFVYLFVWLIMARVSRGRGKVTWYSPGVVFATLWIVGSVAVFGLYANLSNTVGSALVVFGAPIAVLIWTYLVFLGFFLGSLVQAELNERVSKKSSEHQRSPR